MAAIADGVDLLKELLRFDGKAMQANLKGGKAMTYACYGCSLSFLAIMWDFAMEPDFPYFSYVYFLGSVLQFAGFFSLSMMVKGSKSVSGISSQSLVLFTISLTCRCFVTSVYEGYLPADKTGDFWLQATDVATLVFVIYTLYMVHKTYVHSYQSEHDTWPSGYILMPCLVCAYFFHAELNNHEVFDVIWAFGLNVEIFQMMPQLYMLAKVGGLVDQNMTHYVVLTFLSCVCRISFWAWAIPGCEELSSEDGYRWDMEPAGLYILASYILELCVHSDFMYYFVKAWWQGKSTVHLPALSGEI